MPVLSLTRARIAQVVVLVGAVIAVLMAFDVVHWSAEQATTAGAEASAFLVVILAIEQHVRPDTKEEPVAIAQAVTAFVGTTVATLVGFGIVSWSDKQIGVVLALAAVVVSTVGGWAARASVTAKRTPPDA